MHQIDQIVDAIVRQRWGSETGDEAVAHAQDQAADDNDEGHAWVFLLRPHGRYCYMTGYYRDQGWISGRMIRNGENDVIPTSYESLGLHDSKIQAIALIISLMEDQP
jgi:hypothetical protein